MSDNKLATKEDLKEMYNRIYSYLGGMPEMVANKFSKGDLYSTDEKMIGQWIDGKPLYQKTVSATGFSGTSGNRNIEFSDVPYGKVVSMRAFLYEENGYESCSPLNMYSENSGNFYYRCFTYNDGTTHKGNIALYWKDIQQDPTKFTFYFTVQYTKNTDTAISIGNDTDYSTEEKIIGTWVDGKPIYQKTLANLTTPSSTDDWFVIADLSALNIDTFVDVHGRLIAAPSFNVSIPSLWSISTSLNSNFNFGYSDDDKKLHGTVLGPNWLNRPYFLTIQYTKTTD